MVGPLQGVKVVEFTEIIAGPLAGMLLADMGATVIKIEHPKDPDLTREFPPALGGDDEAVSGFFAQYNRNKIFLIEEMQSGQ